MTQPDPPQTPEVQDDTEHHRFLVTQDGAEAQLLYRTRPGRLILVHTEVPPQLGGRGLGSRLAEAALQRARTTGETIVPWCPFVRRHLTEHPDRQEGIQIDWHEPPPPQ